MPTCRNYNEAVDVLAGRESRKVAHNTYLHRVDAETIAVRLHATDIVTYKSDGTVVLDTGGWLTVTTKARLCDYSEYSVSSAGGTWNVSRRNPAYIQSEDYTAPHEPYWQFVARYFDGIALRDGVVLNPTESQAADMAYERDQETKRAVSSYLRGLTAEKVAEIVDRARTEGMAGDCWYCLMRATGGVNDGATLGDATGDHEHLREHLRERYYMASLMLNALKEVGYRDPAVVLMHGGIKSVRSALRRYFYARLLEGPTSGRRPSAARANNWGG